MKNSETQNLGLVIDHLLIGTPDLESGCQYIFERWGVKPVAGGSHPGVGTCNALLGLEDDVYIEIIAPDPAQPADLPLASYLRGLKQSTLMWWAVRSSDFGTLAERLRQNDVEVLSQHPGSRKLPDGRELRWEMLIPDSGELQTAMPFFIKWNDMALHPSRNLPPCGALNSMRVSHPATERLQKILGPCYATGTGPDNQLQVSLNIHGKTVQLTTTGRFPPGIGEFSQAFFDRQERRNQ